MENSTPNRVMLCATDRRSDHLEDLQDVLGEGPYLDAFDLNQPVLTGLDDVAAQRWPEFVPAAADVIGPAGELWSLPMRFGGQPIGAVGLYRLSPGRLAEPSDAAQSLADAAAAILLTDPLAFAESANAGSWSSRAVVHQATGMLIAQLAIDPEAALAILRSHAFACGADLQQVARAVVDRKLDLACL